MEQYFNFDTKTKAIAISSTPNHKFDAHVAIMDFFIDDLGEADFDSEEAFAKAFAKMLLKNNTTTKDLNKVSSWMLGLAPVYWKRLNYGYNKYLVITQCPETNEKHCLTFWDGGDELQVSRDKRDANQIEIYEWLADAVRPMNT